MSSMFRGFSFPSLCTSKSNTILDPSSGFHPVDFSNNIVTIAQPENIVNPTKGPSDKDTSETECCNANGNLVVPPENETKKKINRAFNFKTLTLTKRGEDSNQSIKINISDIQKVSVTDISDPTDPVTALLSDNTVRSDSLKKDIGLSSPEETPDVLSPPPQESKTTKVPQSPVPRTEITFHEETQYLNMIREIINTGSYEKSRNGNTYTKFGYNMRFSLRDGMMPILTTKKMAWKSCFEELFWFIRGSTSSIELQNRGVNIWNGNGTREFLDGRGLYHLEEGDLGPIYGHQWRHFNAEYTNSAACYKGEGIDQLKYIIDELSDPYTRTSRRLIMTAWNPCQINQMALPPCHVMAQFHVRDNKYLSCALFQRSGDVGLGIPFNIASYALLTHILAKHCGLEAEEFVHFLGNCHIYEEHMEALKSQLLLEPMIFPRIRINKRDTIEEYELSDIEWVTPYHCHPPIKMVMKA